jgi:hypothetical protein
MFKYPLFFKGGILHLLLYVGGSLHVRSLPLLRSMIKNPLILHLASMYVEIHDNHIKVKFI